MPDIRILDEHTINKIAAGEVIENPASVIKELVENSLDAGSTEITVEIKGGGRQLIRVSDNGHGMSADGAVLCLERHATSKIRNVEDIHELTTMGFRGEALPSIASISKFTLITCQRKEQEKHTNGTMVVVEGGQILSCTPAARSPGTTIEVKSLFFNIPVRKKFQKSPAYDTQEIIKILTTLSLGYPHIKFELISDQKQLLHSAFLSDTTNFQTTFGKRIETTLGKEFFSSLTPITFHNDQYKLEGFIGLPSYHRPNRTGQYLFINQRAVHSPLVSFAVREGYGTALATSRYPVFALHLHLPGSFIDVNVHPQKKEVRLRQEQHLKELIIKAVQQTIQGISGINSSSLPSVNHSPVPFTFSDTYEKILFPLSSDIKESHLMAAEAPSIPFKPSFTIPSEEQEIPAFEPFKKKFTEPSYTHTIKNTEQPHFQFISKHQTPTVLSTTKGFILLTPASLISTFADALYSSQDEGLYVVNQHLAYARLYYERSLKHERDSSRQPLLLPITLEFSPADAALLNEYLPLLNQMGFSIQEFGNHTFAIDAIPDLIKEDQLESYLQMLLIDLKEFQDHKRLQREQDKHLALAACRRASRSNKRLSHEEAQVLINQLAQCEQPLHCPLGRAVIVHLSSEQLHQLFHK